MKAMLNRTAVFVAAALIVAACGEADDDTQVEVTNDVDGSGQVQSDEGDGETDAQSAETDMSANPDAAPDARQPDDEERTPEEAASIVEQLRNETLLNDDGTLREDIDRSNIAIVDYIYPQVESLAELVNESQLIVLAEATERDQRNDGPLVATYQDFEVRETLQGEDRTTVTVSFGSGVEVPEDVENPDIEIPQNEVVLLQGQEDPQYLQGQQYLLFLGRFSDDQEVWSTYGPGVGRYIVEDGNVTGTFLDEMVAQVGADSPRFENDRDNPDRYDPLDLVGMSVDEVADQIASAGS